LVAMGAIRLVHRQEQSPRRNEQPQRRRSDYRASGLVLRPKAARRKLRKRPFIE